MSDWGRSFIWLARYRGSILRNVALFLPEVIGAGRLVAGPSAASSGSLNARGCHNDRKGGTGYHCHNRPATGAGVSLRTLSMSSTVAGIFHFPNCAPLGQRVPPRLERGHPAIPTSWTATEMVSVAVKIAEVCNDPKADVPSGLRRSTLDVHSLSEVTLRCDPALV